MKEWFELFIDNIKRTMIILFSAMALTIGFLALIFWITNMFGIIVGAVCFLVILIFIIGVAGATYDYNSIK
jgi:hypothetical protein